ncbi:hypothetical protein B0H11DRAFT_2199390 [Mycena galericulata]|nr:hypothetical protein B0H11DRAFT_2199390 [Mycena galericulata]
MSGLSLPAAELIEQTISNMLYGIYLVTLGITGRLLLTTESGRWKRRSEIKWIMVAVSVLLFVNSTLDLIVSTITLVQAFVLYTGPGGATHIFSHGSGWQTMIKTFCVPFQTLVGDGIMIYRCWFVWNGSWAIITLPVLTWFANIASAIRIMDLLSRVSEGLVLSSNIQPWLEVFWSLTICIQVMTTSMIVARIWMVERHKKKLSVSTIDSTNSQASRTLSHVMRNIIESGMIYTAATILTLALYTVGDTLLYPASAVEIHSVGITFNLILIRGTQTTRPRSETSVTAPLQFTHTQATGRDYMPGPSDSDGTFVLNHTETDSHSTSASMV